LISCILNITSQVLSQLLSVQNEASFCHRIPTSRCRSRYAIFPMALRVFFFRQGVIYSVFISICGSTFLALYFHNYHKCFHTLSRILQDGRSRVRFPMVSLEFFIEIILPATLWSLGWLSP
jgi:hypothetical protein